MDQALVSPGMFPAVNGGSVASSGSHSNLADGFRSMLEAVLAQCAMGNETTGQATAIGVTDGLIKWRQNSRPLANANVETEAGLGYLDTDALRLCESVPSNPAKAAKAGSHFVGTKRGAKPPEGEAADRERQSVTPYPYEKRSRLPRLGDRQIGPEVARNGMAPDYLLDRRTVVREPSKLPRFSVIVEDYLRLRTLTSPDRLKDIKSARTRIGVFLDLIGDHPVDRYEASDLQAFVLLMGHWPAKSTQRKTSSSWEVLEESRRLNHRALAEKSLKDGYLATIRAAMRWGTTSYFYKDPFKDIPLRYPSRLSLSRETLPLSAHQLTAVFNLGVRSGHMDEAMLPLLGHLTGRRLSVLIHLRGSDIIQKYQDIWVAQPRSALQVEERVRRVPIKTKASAKFFVLHDFLRRIGFIDWAVSRGDRFLFPELMRLHDPSKSASQYMKRLFMRAGIPPRSGEVFHSLRGDYIDELRDHQISTRTARLQVGHSVGPDVHARYGSRSIREVSAKALAHVPMRPDVDYSMFERLDFGRMARSARQKGVRGSVELPLESPKGGAFGHLEG